MRLLFLGDMVGRSGRTAVWERLPGLISDLKLDFVIVNGENAAGGFGITEEIFRNTLAAFDARGHRIGYGAGYYDRAIAKLQAGPQPPRLVGIAFDCQEVDAVPNQPHDIVIPEMLTESGLRRLGQPA